MQRLRRSPAALVAIAFVTQTVFYQAFAAVKDVRLALAAGAFNFLPLE